MALLELRDYTEAILQVLELYPEGFDGGALIGRVADLTRPLRAPYPQTAPERSSQERAIARARDYLVSDGRIEQRSDGLFGITDSGRALVEMHDARWRPPPEGAHAKEGLLSPDAFYAPLELNIESVNRALRVLHQAVEVDLAERLARCSPQFFEHVVLVLLKAMGYGDFEHTGGPGDHGIDGILRSDPLGLDMTYVQAKHRQPEGPVGAGDVQKFRGVVLDRPGARGVFVTNGRFTGPAEDLAPHDRSLVRLIDGTQLIALMMQHGVGVLRAEVRVVPGVDRPFFDKG
jgi:restriction system protein